MNLFEADLQNQNDPELLVSMSTDSREAIRLRVAATRARQAAAGMVQINAVVPADIVAEIDRMKEARGEGSRAPIIIEAVRFYLENTRA